MKSNRNLIHDYSSDSSDEAEKETYSVASWESGSEYIPESSIDSEDENSSDASEVCTDMHWYITTKNALWVLMKYVKYKEFFKI